MEKMSFIFLIIIIVYLFISFITRKNKYNEKKTLPKKNNLNINKKEENVLEKNILGIVAVVIASVMTETPYVLKRVYLTGEVNEKKSSWKLAARSENMIKRSFFK